MWMWLNIGYPHKKGCLIDVHRQGRLKSLVRSWILTHAHVILCLGGSRCHPTRYIFCRFLHEFACLYFLSETGPANRKLLGVVEVILCRAGRDDHFGSQDLRAIRVYSIALVLACLIIYHYMYYTILHYDICWYYIKSFYVMFISYMLYYIIYYILCIICYILCSIYYVLYIICYTTYYILYSIYYSVYTI
jgi:hypothetical protein